MKDTIKTIYTIIGIGLSLFILGYLVILSILFLTWLGGII